MVGREEPNVAVVVEVLVHFTFISTLVGLLVAHIVAFHGV